MIIYCRTHIKTARIKQFALTQLLKNGMFGYLTEILKMFLYISKHFLTDLLEKDNLI